MNIITCEQCGKTKGDGPAGTSWICSDCRVVPPSNPDKPVRNQPQ
ncbi:hypothetical protein [Paenibacillus tyrfis]|nr:hypothetical protein [Paenibacillus tyrfis]